MTGDFDDLEVENALPIDCAAETLLAIEALRVMRSRHQLRRGGVRAAMVHADIS